jgi:hypothetical protein
VIDKMINLEQVGSILEISQEMPKQIKPKEL